MPAIKSRSQEAAPAANSSRAASFFSRTWANTSGCARMASCMWKGWRSLCSSILVLTFSGVDAPGSRLGWCSRPASRARHQLPAAVRAGVVHTGRAGRAEGALVAADKGGPALGEGGPAAFARGAHLQAHLRSLLNPGL